MIFSLSNRGSLGEDEGRDRWVDGILLSEGKPGGCLSTFSLYFNILVAL